MAEALEPGAPHFDAALDLKEMRTLKRVLDNRMLHPELYNAAGAKDERDILMARGQIPEFDDYPKNLPQHVTDAVTFANKIGDPRQAAYRRHVLNAIQVSNEKVDPSQTEYPNATAWY